MKTRVAIKCLALVLVVILASSIQADDKTHPKIRSVRVRVNGRSLGHAHHKHHHGHHKHHGRHHHHGHKKWGAIDSVKHYGDLVGIKHHKRHHTFKHHHKHKPHFRSKRHTHHHKHHGHHGHHGHHHKHGKHHKLHIKHILGHKHHKHGKHHHGHHKHNDKLLPRIPKLRKFVKKVRKDVRKMCIYAWKVRKSIKHVHLRASLRAGYFSRKFGSQSAGARRTKVIADRIREKLDKLTHIVEKCRLVPIEFK
ncbi:hypothetical protein AKO1_014449 [Acrasis kona]|uniref:Histidine-rich glycoprotein n=1 Tax=Acrasis kona TaxID=1008807 RepID=A0AAW2Z0I8_9EUKA